MKHRKIIAIFIFLLVPFSELVEPRIVLSDDFWIETSDQKLKQKCLLLKIEGKKLLCYNDGAKLIYDLGVVETINVDRNGENYRIENITKDKYSKLTTAINNIYNEQVNIIANNKKNRHAKEKAEEQKQDGAFADNSIYRRITNVNVRQIYDYSKLLKMTYSELHDIFMYVIRNEKQFPSGYLDHVKSASNFVSLQNAEDRLDRSFKRGDSVSDKMDALDAYGKARVKSEMQ